VINRVARWGGATFILAQESLVAVIEGGRAAVGRHAEAVEGSNTSREHETASWALMMIQPHLQAYMKRVLTFSNNSKYSSNIHIQEHCKWWKEEHSNWI
jgi:hypothetical protein